MKTVEDERKYYLLDNNQIVQSPKGDSKSSRATSVLSKTTIQTDCGSIQRNTQEITSKEQLPILNHVILKLSTDAPKGG